MNQYRYTNRRTVLKATGGLLSIAGLSGTAAATRTRNKTYGNGNGIGAFLNEEAMFKESPVWDTGVADKTAQNEVDVLWGGLTDIVHPETGETVPGPWGVDPRAVKVSPGTDVTWTWYDGPRAIDAHHLVSFFDPPYEGEFPNPLDRDPHEHPGGEEEFFVHEDLGDSFTYTFDDVGTYLYFCFPHGTPYEFNLSRPNEPEFLVENLFGQRGVVKVVND